VAGIERPKTPRERLGGDPKELTPEENKGTDAGEIYALTHVDRVLAYPCGAWIIKLANGQYASTVGNADVLGTLDEAETFLAREVGL